MLDLRPHLNLWSALLSNGNRTPKLRAHPTAKKTKSKDSPPPDTPPKKRAKWRGFEPRPIYTIDLEGMQRVSTLGVIDPETGVRSVWCPDAAMDFFEELVDEDPTFNRDKYCLRCERYDKKLGILPHEKTLPKIRARDMVKRRLNPVDLPWVPKTLPGHAKLHGWQKSRPGMPQKVDACHMCLISFLDEQEPPELTAEEADALKTEFREARSEWARLKRASRNVEHNSEAMTEYIDRRLEQAKRRTWKAAGACRDAGFHPSRPRAHRIGDEAPSEVGKTELEL